MEKDELTYNVIGCAMKVHNTLGNGFQELIYHRCLAIELKKEKIKFTQEQEQIIYYEGIEVGVRRVDFVVGNTIIVELKAVEALTDVHLAQVLTYLKLSNVRLGLLINFNVARLMLGVRRVIL